MGPEAQPLPVPFDLEGTLIRNTKESYFGAKFPELLHDVHDSI